MLTYRMQSPMQPRRGRAAPALFLLHGIGSHEQDLFSLAPYIPPSFYVFSLRAPFPYTWGGFSWFDLTITPQRVSADPTMAAHSRQEIQTLRHDFLQRYPLDPQRCYLLGFSQGAILSLSLLFHHPESWGGIVAMSGAVMPELCPPPRDPQTLSSKPILLIHGQEDTVVPLSYGELSRDYLRNCVGDAQLTYRTYPMGHEISPASLQEVIHTLNRWIEN